LVLIKPLPESAKIKKPLKLEQFTKNIFDFAFFNGWFD